MKNRTMKNKSFLLILNLFLLSSIGFGQEEIKIDLEWGNTAGVMESPTDKFEFPVLEGAFVSESEFLFLKAFQRNSRAEKWKLDLLTFQTAPIDKVTKGFLSLSMISVPTSPEYLVKNGMKSSQPTAVLSLLPFVKVNGEVRKILSISFRKNVNNEYMAKAGAYAAESVLNTGSGDWYKISVKNNGIYKLDYSFLKSIGVDVDHLIPDHLNVYGNSFGRLPELNSDYRPDDLLKNDILMVDGGDGSFDQGDYVLFYAKGPNKWMQKNDHFERILNNYSTISTYFININSNETPARIQNAFTSNQPATTTVTDYDSYTIHEKNERNLLKSGQRWYGEVFDAHLTQNFSFNIPNLNPSGAARVRAYMASNDGSSIPPGGSGLTNFEARYKGTSIGKAYLASSSKDSYSRSGFVTQPGDFSPTSSTFSIQLTFSRLTPSNVGYLDFIEVNARSYLKYFNEMEFQDMQSVGTGNIAEFQISNFPANGVVWETTNPTTPRLVNGINNGGTFSFKVATDTLRRFISFQGSSFSAPKYEGKVNYQNLHGLSQADYLIVTHPRFLSQANRLADLHRNKGLTVHVVTTNQVYNEFSGGTQDPTAIRTFAKMFYDRAAGDPNKEPKYLLLFGDGTYDPLNRISNNNNMVVTYESVESEMYTTSVVSDDYFGFLDDGDEFSPLDLLNIAVGRLVATTNEDAVNLVNKIELYMKNGSSLYASNDLACGEDGYISTFGDWRLRYTVIADDEQNGYFVSNDLDPAASYVDSAHPEMNVKKIYSDAYQQITTAGGQRYPEVNDDIERSIEAGSLVTCYVGHGGPTGAAQERIITVGMMKDLTNIDKLTLFVSATCDFAQFDDNERVNVGEWMALNEIGGAIALMTTSRAILISVNSVVTEEFFKKVFVRTPSGQPKTFGEIIVETKNQVGGSNNKRSFILLGDPALQIALPTQKIVLDSVNNVDVNIENDTLRALSRVRMKGHVEDLSGNTLTGFNGVLQPSIYDKPQKSKTLAQDPDSPEIEFEKQESVLFKGKASVTNGIFEFEFIVPKDIDYSYGKGKASLYSWSDNSIDAGGFSTDFVIGGIDTNGLNDQQGPDIELYLNNENFVNGGITDETPILKAKLYDESGINTVGNGIGHDITMIIDDNTSDAIVLNAFYESDLDTYKSGKLSYQLKKLSPGRHTLTFKAWDVNNNSSEKRIEFTVQRKQEMALDHVLNYPNPFTTQTKFFFEHNQTCTALQTQIQVFTVTGKLVKTINRTVQTNGFRAEGIPWDGRDDFGDQLARGVYVYRITVKNPDGGKAQEMQKLYLLK